MKKKIVYVGGLKQAPDAPRNQTSQGNEAVRLLEDALSLIKHGGSSLPLEMRSARTNAGYVDRQVRVK